LANAMFHAVGGSELQESAAAAAAAVLSAATPGAFAVPHLGGFDPQGGVTALAAASPSALTSIPPPVRPTFGGQPLPAAGSFPLTSTVLPANPHGLNPQGLNPQGTIPQGVVPQGLLPPAREPIGLGGTVDDPRAAQSRLDALANQAVQELFGFSGAGLPMGLSPPPIKVSDVSLVNPLGVRVPDLSGLFKAPSLQAASGALPANPALPSQLGRFDVEAVRRDFPILQTTLRNGKPLVWFDNAATTQKPQVVIDRLSHFYRHENSNVHRAAHELAERSTDAYENARNIVAQFLGASSAAEIVFVRGATEAINLVAQTFGRQQLGAGDEILLSHLEHHANIVPWQQIAAVTGAVLRVIPVDDSGQLLLSALPQLLGPRTKIVALTQVSNALGTVTPVAEVVALAHRVGARVLVDGAQAVSHMRVNVKALDADFYVFSGHKVFGPTGIGVVYGKQDLLQSLPPYQGGGNMIRDVTFEHTTFQDAPARFEAGTGNIADAVGLGAALQYLQGLGLERVGHYEHELLAYATDQVRRVPGLKVIGTAAHKASVLSFVIDGHSNSEVGQALSEAGIAVRSGHHCAQPILRRFGLESSVRASLAFYNTREEVDYLLNTLLRLSLRNPHTGR
jgi:SufS family cysteine desulfurase